MRTPRRRWVVLLVVVVLLLAGAVAVVAVRSSDEPAVASTDVTIDVLDGPARDTPQRLDATFYTPAVTPAPVVMLAHGFGGSKDSVADQARALTRAGYAVLAWSATGFGASTGQIWLNSPDHEVADAVQLVDWLAARPEVALDAPGDPRVGVAGESYGGALALELAGVDRRVDAVASSITWNDLGQALFPDLAAPSAPDAGTPAAGATGSDGVLKRSWAGIFFGSGQARPGGGGGGGGGGGAAAPTGDPTCGRFAPEICAAYQQAAVTGRPTAALLDTLRAGSPAAVADRVTAPVLLAQGEQDTLFGLDQSDATARQVSAGGGAVSTFWFAGGHDTGGTTPAVRDRVAQFLDVHLRGAADPDGAAAPGAFSYEVPGSVRTDGTVRTRTVRAEGYPGLAGAAATPTTTQQLRGGDATVVRPPGATPAAISTVPGLGALAGAAAGALSGLASLDLPGQTATFTTDPLTTRLVATGSSRVALTVAELPTGGAPTGEAVLYAKLYDVAADGSRTLPGGAVAPLRVTGLPADGSPATVVVTLPGIVRPVEAGHRLELAVATTDQAYATPATPQLLRVGLADPALAVPTVAGAATTTSTVPLAPLLGIVAVLLAVVAALGVGLLRRRRGAGVDVDPALADTPLVVRGLAKSYADGFRAVDGVDLTVRHGQVLGLLGPNGAGKTTTLRMLMGLITPSDGEIRVFGHRIRPGSPVLSRLGSFVEGSGFLPHLSGQANLRLYWEATGRPAADAHLEEALAIAGLGAAVGRKVKSYSQGMRQRLAIAQAMLGLPDLLVLDEPTNGLDPPQIKAMREVLRDYARTGRTVLVSSHLLAEVEQTCTDVVVMHKGRVVAAGTVAEIVSADGRVVARVDDTAAAVTALRGLDGVGAVHESEPGVVQADLEGVPAADAVRTLVSAGVSVTSVAPRNRLEDVFLALVDTPTAAHPGGPPQEDPQ
ncbi:alpha/beta fold hydrolase [Rhodococcus aerolatus]